jgi:hypothetical protein
MSPWAVICVTALGDSVTQIGDHRHLVNDVRGVIKYSSCNPGNTELPGLTPLPHTAATPAADRAIVNKVLNLGFGNEECLIVSR